MHPPDTIPAERSAQAAYKRDRTIILVALILVCASAWLYTVTAAQQMDDGSSGKVMLLPYTEVPTASQVTMVFLMWVIMMEAMMLPSVSPCC